MSEQNYLIRCVSASMCALLLVMPLAGADHPALAAPTTGHTYVVNSALDEPDADPANGVCASTPSGQCTLRAAIMLSNVASGPNTIVLPAGNYVITRPGYDDTALQGDFDIGHDLTLQGAGSSATIVDGNGALSHDRVFQILSTVQNVTLSGLTIRNGQSLSSTIGGGGIYMEGAGHLRLSDVILAGNRAQNGGGLFANLGSQGGAVELDHVIVRANTVTAGGVGAGAGAWIHLPASASTLDVHDSEIYSNTADGTGGGLYIDGNFSAHWSVERSQFYSNTAASGGAIGNFLPLSLADSRVHDNRAVYDGGAIEAFSPFTLTRTTVETNTAGRFGGAIFDLDESSNAGIDDFANIAQSTFSGNFAQSGGAIYHDGYIDPLSRLTLTNSTVSGNGVFRRSTGTGSADGGGLYQYGGITQLSYSTIASNRVQLGMGIHQYPGIGGGVYITASATFTAENSLIAYNSDGNGFTADTPDDCFSSGTAGELAYDLFLTTTNCFVTGPQSGNIVGHDPLLGPLQDNGGATPTRALLPGSPAIGAGAPAGCTGTDGAPVTTDQRGAPRPASHCDIGAFQVVPEADLSVAEQASASTVPTGARLTYTLTVANNGPVTATGVVLTDTLPARLTLNLADATQGSCSGAVTILCHLGTISDAGLVTVTVEVTPTLTGMISNTVMAGANEFDPALLNNTATQTTNVGRLLYLPLVTRSP